MNSGLVPFEEMLEDLKDQTGIKNTEPYLEKLRRLAFKAEREIGYSGAIVLKKVIYFKDNTNFDGQRIWLPQDYLEFRRADSAYGEINRRKYLVSGNYLHFTDGISRDSVAIFYYGLMSDGFGNPCITRNHQQAVVDYWKWRIKSPMAFMSNQRSDRALERDYEQDWKDSRDAAQGNDVWPENDQEWATLSVVGSMSSQQLMAYGCAIASEPLYALEAQSECSLREEEKMIDVYSWQYADTVSGIALAPGIALDWLAENTVKNTIESMVIGKTIGYSKIGRIAFAVQGGSEKEYEIFDVLGKRIDEIVFEYYRNDPLKLDIYISKEFYSHSNIFFKLKKS